MAKIIDGKQISLDIKNELKEKVAKYKEQGIEITLAVVKVGNDPASAVYVRNKEKACEYKLKDFGITWRNNRRRAFKCC